MMKQKIQKPLTAFEDYAAKLISDPRTGIKNTTDVVELLLDDVCNAYIEMHVAETIAEFQRAGDIWFSAQCLLFSERHFQ